MAPVPDPRVRPVTNCRPICREFDLDLVATVVHEWWLCAHFKGANWENGQNPDVLQCAQPGGRDAMSGCRSPRCVGVFCETPRKFNAGGSTSAVCSRRSERWMTFTHSRLEDTVTQSEETPKGWVEVTLTGD